MGAFAVTNAKTAVVDIHPPSVLRAVGPQAGTRSGGGAFRAVRCTLTGSASYATNGDTLPATLPGIKRVEALLVLAQDDAAVNSDGRTLRLNTAGANAGKVQVFETASNTEVANATSLAAASWEVLILGR